MADLAREMLEYEVHALRNLTTVMLIQVQLYARQHPEAQPLADLLVGWKQRMLDAEMEALRDPVKRRARPE